MATLADIRSVLRNVTSLRIRGDLAVYSASGSGQDTTYLDDVALRRCTPWPFQSPRAREPCEGGGSEQGQFGLKGRS